MSHVDLDRALELLDELTLRVAALEAGRARERGRQAGENRARAAQNMSPETWNAIYGRPGPTSQVVGELRASNLKGRHWGPLPSGPAFQSGADADKAELRTWGGS